MPADSKACDSCVTSFPSPHMLPEHGRQNSLVKPVAPDICSMSFSREDGLKSHLTSHKQSFGGSFPEQNPFKCHACPKSFGEKRDLEDHLSLHKDRRRFDSDICQDLYALKEASSTRNSESCLGRTYQSNSNTCHICSRSFSQSSDLLKHATLHTTEKPYTCDICGRQFRLKDVLRRHKMIHSGKKPHRCEVCPKSFVKRRDYETHVRTHTGEKPFVCGHCNQAFRCKRSLRVHSRTHASYDTSTQKDMNMQ